MTPDIAFCPGCRQDTPFATAGAMRRCQRCGFECPLPSEADPRVASTRNRLPWIWCLLIFLAPLCSTVGARLLRLDEAYQATAALVGSIAPALVCPAIIAWRSTQSVPTRVLIWLLLAPVTYVASVALCMFGCSIVSSGFPVR